MSRYSTISRLRNRRPGVRLPVGTRQFSRLYIVRPGSENNPPPTPSH